MKLPLWRVSQLALALVTAVCCAGCETPRTNPATDLQWRMTANLYPALRGTVREFAALGDSTPMRVEGYGIVANLPDTGSPVMDPRIHELMMNRLLTIGIGMYSTGTQNVSPEAILASRKIAVVEVRGVIPPLARKGSTFDLYVNSLPGSDTTSLANGLLWPCDLKQIGLTFDGNDTRTIASGRGPTFIPGSLEAEADRAAGLKPGDMKKVWRSARIIAGGVCGEDRDARLQLYTPDWMRTRLIERAIVARFPGRERPASAANQTVVDLHIPPEYRENAADFVDLCRHLYLATDEPGFIEHKAVELVEALKDPKAPHRDLGLALQGLGRSILPDYLQPNYTSSNPQVRFWCARAGACLQDVQGMATLQEIVRDASHPLRRQALMAMIEASRGRDTERATLALYDLVRSYNVDDRILGYHALLAIRSRAVATYDVGRKFMMDVIPADSPPLIYVMESDSPRIAFIGKELALPAGSVVLSRDKLLTVRADDPVDNTGPQLAPVLMPGMSAATKPKEKDTVTLYWRSPLGDKTQLLRAMPSLPAVVSRACWVPDPMSKDYDPSAEYIGASYQRITELLAMMCAEKTLDATFVVQRSADLLVSPAEQALSIRPDGSTRQPPPEGPTTAPAVTQPAPATAPGGAISPR
jgi:hypothetical protein